MSSRLLRPEDIDRSFVPRFRDPVATVPVAQEAVLYEQDTGDLHRLDHVAALVCSLFDGQTSVAQAVDELAEAFSAPHETIEADVLLMVRDLGRKGLLEDVDAPISVSDQGSDDGC
jgi:hypothetical protein